MIVDVARDLLVLEALLLHHVAPVAGGVADREEDRPLQCPRALERLFAPREPVHRVVRVLQQVRARFEDQPVGELRRPVGMLVARAWNVVRPLRGERRLKPRGELDCITILGRRNLRGRFLRRRSSAPAPRTPEERHEEQHQPLSDQAGRAAPARCAVTPHPSRRLPTSPCRESTPACRRRSQP